MTSFIDLDHKEGSGIEIEWTSLVSNPSENDKSKWLRQTLEHVSVFEKLLFFTCYCLWKNNWIPNTRRPLASRKTQKKDLQTTRIQRNSVIDLYEQGIVRRGVEKSPVLPESSTISSDFFVPPARNLWKRFGKLGSTCGRSHGEKPWQR